MGIHKDIKGKRFNRLIAIRFVRYYIFPNGSKHQLYLFRCDCGKEKIIDKNRVLRGGTKSCGCLQREIISKNGKDHFRHGMGKTKFYRTWVHIKERCYKKYNSFNSYGKKGIIVCDRWKNNFLNFKEDMYISFIDHVNKYGENDTQIDRIDNNGNYEKDNCRWVTAKENTNNRDVTCRITFNGKTKSISEWSGILGISRRLLYERIIESKWPIKKAFITPKNKYGFNQKI